MSRKGFQSLLLIVLIISLTMASGILGQVLPTNIQGRLKSISIFGLPNELLWGAAIILVVLLTAVATILKERIDSASENKKATAPESKEERERVKFLADLRERYDERLAHKLDGRSELPLVITDESDHAKAFQVDEAGEYLIKRFNIRGRLLLAGKPGSGKTTLLLKLAKERVLKAQDDIAEPFPVVLNLASWSTKYTDFHLWVRGMLTKGYGVSASFAQELLDNRRITFLLDGLDEVARNEEPENAAKIRASCLSALDRALPHGSISMVICCREEELELLRPHPGLQKPWVTELKVHELTPEQIDLALIRASAGKADRFAAPNLNKELGSDETGIYEQVLSTPFYFTTALNVFDATTPPVADTTSRTDLESHLVSAFIEKKLQKTKNKYRFKKDSTLKWTTWLATFLNERVTFELSDLQPSSLRRPWLYKCTFSLLCAVIGGLVMGLYSRLPEVTVTVAILFGLIGAYSITDDFGWWTLAPLKRMRTWMIAIAVSWMTSIVEFSLLLIARVEKMGIRRVFEISESMLMLIGVISVINTLALVASLILSLCIRSGLGLYVMGPISPILTEDFGNWSFSSLFDLHRWKKVARLGFEGGAAGSFILTATGVVVGIGLLIYFVFLTVIGRARPELAELFTIVGMTPLIIIVLAIAGFLSGLMCGATAGIVGLCREPARFVSIKSPYQRLRAGILLNILQSVAVWWLLHLFVSVLSVPFYLSGSIKFVASDLSPFNLRFFVIFGLMGLFRTPIFKHAVLRICLALEGAIPFRYARFLNYVTDMGILEKEGGQWRFRHQILQSHFTSPQTSD